MDKKNQNAVFAGSFDPFTMGHYDIVSRAADYFDKIYVGVAAHSGTKKCFLTLDERALIIKKSLSSIKNVEVMTFDGFLVDFAKSCNANCIVRGLRTSADFEYEKALSEVYKSQSPLVENFFLISSHNYCHISSTIVRELALMGGEVKGYVHENAENLVKELYSKTR